jgi:hypothetical protein
VAGEARCRHIHIVLDVSGSMRAMDEIVKKPKIEIIEESLNSDSEKSFKTFLSNPNLPPEVVDRLKMTWLSVGYFGEDKYYDSKDYLFDIAGLGKVVNLGELRLKLSQGEADYIVSRDDVESVGGDGTDVWQAVRSVEAAVKKLRSSCMELKTTIVFLTDACFNKSKCDALPPSLEERLKAIMEARAAIENAVGSESLRAVMMLLYGENSEFEYDEGVCPIRAAAMADHKARLAASGRSAVLDVWDKLHEGQERALIYDDQWDNYVKGDLPVIGGSLKDYLVARIVNLYSLGSTVIQLTTERGRRD